MRAYHGIPSDFSVRLDRRGNNGRLPFNWRWPVTTERLSGLMRKLGPAALGPALVTFHHGQLEWALNLSGPNGPVGLLGIVFTSREEWASRPNTQGFTVLNVGPRHVIAVTLLA